MPHTTVSMTRKPRLEKTGIGKTSARWIMKNWDSGISVVVVFRFAMVLANMPARSGHIYKSTGQSRRQHRTYQDVAEAASCSDIAMTPFSRLFGRTVV